MYKRVKKSINSKHLFQMSQDAVFQDSEIGAGFEEDGGKNHTNFPRNVSKR